MHSQLTLPHEERVLVVLLRKLTDGDTLSFVYIGGYYRRWEGGMSLLKQPLLQKAGLTSFRITGLLAPRYRRSMSGSPSPLTLPERLTLSFLKVLFSIAPLVQLGCETDLLVVQIPQADKHVLENIPESQTSGSTASILLLHSLSTGSSQPFFSAPTLSLTVAHVGDTRVLLTGLNGTTEALTESHHAEARVELARLRRLAGRTGSVVDAFGETRWMGAVENTRAFGDGRWKKDGVTGEPQISSRVLDGQSPAVAIPETHF